MITRGPEGELTGRRAQRMLAKKTAQRMLAKKTAQRMLAEKTMNAPVASHGDLDFTWTGARWVTPVRRVPS
jgi:hypothetical protein